MNHNNSHSVDLGQLGAHMPWAQVFQDLKYPMPYPEVVMAGELAYAQFTQMNSLLMMLSWEGDNSASYTLTPLKDEEEGVPTPYRLVVSLELEGYNEAWGLVGIGQEALEDYLHQAVAAWVIHRHWAGQEVRSVRIDRQSWTLLVP